MKKQRFLQIIFIIAIAFCFSFLAFNTKVKALGYEPGGTTVHYYVNNGEVGEFTDNTTIYGTSVEIEATVVSGKTFLFWTNFGRIISTEATLNIPIYGNEYLVSHYKTTDTFVAVYIDINNDYITMTDGLTTPEGAPGKMGYTFDGWTAPGILTEDTYIRASYTAGQIESELDTTENNVKMGYFLCPNNLAFLVDVDSGSTPVEMGVIYNADGDPKETVGSTLRRATRYSSNYEFSVMTSIGVDEEVYAYAYVVTESGGVYTTEYSRLVTVYNYTITYNLDYTEHIIERSQLITEFMLDFNLYDGNDTDITASEIYSGGSTRQQVFWTNSQMLNKWGWLLSYFQGFNMHEAAVTMYTEIIAGSVPTETSYWAPRQDLQGFMTETKCTNYSSAAAIDFTFAGNAYYYGNTSEPTSQLYFGELSTAFKLGYDFSGWIDESENPITIPTGSITLSPTWTPITYDITYNLGGGDLVTEHDSYTILSDFILDTPTQSGYVFAGWFNNSSFTGNPIGMIGPSARYGDLTLYARWMEEAGSPLGFDEVGQFTITTYNTSIWSGSETNIYLDPDGTGGQYFYKIILSATESSEFIVSQIIASGTTYTFNGSTDDYSIHIASANTTGYTTVTALGIQVGDIILFPGTDLSTLVAGNQSILVYVLRPAIG